jgi:hypothetical protein
MVLPKLAVTCSHGARSAAELREPCYSLAVHSRDMPLGMSWRRETPKFMYGQMGALAVYYFCG